MFGFELCEPAQGDIDIDFNGKQKNLTTPVLTNPKLDPFERFQEARSFDEWQGEPLLFAE